MSTDKAKDALGTVDGSERSPPSSRATPAVTFDLWHTLCYLDEPTEERYVHQQVELAVAALLEEPGGERGSNSGSGEQMREAFIRERRRANAAAEEGRVVSLETQLTLAASSIGRRADVGAYLRSLSAELGRTSFRYAPGAHEVLRSLKDAGYRIGIISNTVGEKGAFLRPVLERIGLAPMLDILIFSDETSWTKPHPSIFQDALQRLGSSPAHAVHVGDAWADIEGARRAGLRAAVLFTGLQDYSPSYRDIVRPGGARPMAAEHQIAQLSELPPLLRTLLPLGG